MKSVKTICLVILLTLIMLGCFVCFICSNYLRKNPQNAREVLEFNYYHMSAQLDSRGKKAAQLGFRSDPTIC